VVVVDVGISTVPGDLLQTGKALVVCHGPDFLLSFREVNPTGRANVRANKEIL
jgi:hypothetical protein